MLWCQPCVLPAVMRIHALQGVVLGIIVALLACVGCVSLTCSLTEAVGYTLVNVPRPCECCSADIEDVQRYTRNSQRSIDVRKSTALPDTPILACVLLGYSSRIGAAAGLTVTGAPRYMQGAHARPMASAATERTGMCSTVPTTLRHSPSAAAWRRSCRYASASQRLGRHTIACISSACLCILAPQCFSRADAAQSYIVCLC